MVIFQKGLRVLLFLAVGCLVLNDVARLVCPSMQQAFLLYTGNQDPAEEETTPVPASNLLEEEAKHHHPHHLLEPISVPEDEADTAKSHLIQDDDISVLAFITIFSPPPNRA